MPAQIPDIIIQIDHIVWYYVNVLWHNPLLDAVLPYFRNQWTWAPLYLFLAVFMPLNYGRKGLMWCVFFILTFTLADSLSASLIKPYFARLRPCNDPRLSQIVHLLVSCGSGYSFPSTHACNHFALAVFSAISLQHIVKRIWYIAIAWAFIVSYSQVYVGVHFPLDVIIGGLLGALAGIVTGNVFKRVYQLNSNQLTTANEQSA